MLTYELDKTRSEPMYLQIYRHIRADIELGELHAGDRLPSKRSLASHLGVSVITVENAYAQLLAEGYIRSYPKKGYFVESIPAIQPTVRKATELPTSVQEKQTEENSLFPFTVWARLMRDTLASDQTRLLTRPPSEGVWELREAIAGHLKHFRNMNVSPAQIIIGAGTEYLYLLIGILLGRNTAIAVEEPGYRKIADIYESMGMQCRWIPMEQDGISLNDLMQSDANVVHISPSHHFPTGCVTSIGRRYALLGWAAQQENRYLIEDDYDSEFRLSGKPIPPLFSVDVTDRVIYMNTFTNSLTPTIRISYMILPPPLLTRFREQLGYFSCTVSTFEQYTLARFIGEGYFEKHIRRVRKRCLDKRNALLRNAKQDILFQNAEFLGTDTGMYCVVKFCGSMSDTELAEALHVRGIREIALRTCYHVCPEQDMQLFLLYY